MKLNSNSLFAKLYKFTYTTKNLPNNLCPYFWANLWAFITFIPSIILQLPALIFGNLFNMSIFKGYDTSDRINIGFKTIFTSIIILLVVIFEYNFLKALFGAYSYEYLIANIALVINCVILGIILLIIVITKIQDINYSGKLDNNVLIQFIKAKYNKYCPKIDWK